MSFAQRLVVANGFNTQPPEGGCELAAVTSANTAVVSTHSRPKAAAFHNLAPHNQLNLFQHTAARRRLRSPLEFSPPFIRVSTHSRPKAAATTFI